MATTEAQSDANMSDSDSSIFLSEPLGAKTLDARSMVPAEFQDPPDALDTLAIPATATECERTFSSAKKLVTPERNCLGDDVIEVSECLKVWQDNRMITQRY